MKKLIILSIFLLGGILNIYSQAVGEWKTYLSYFNTNLVAETNDKVFGVANGALYSYDKEDNSVRYYSRQTGLSDTDITTIAYHPDKRILVIAYNGGNIDLWTTDGIYNMPYLKNSTTIQEKNITSIYFEDEYAYLSAEFGITVINLNRKEIMETYRFSNNVSSSFVLDGYVYAASGKEVLRGSISNNLIDPNNWESYFTVPENSEIKKMCLFDNRIFFLLKSGQIYYYNSGNLHLWNDNLYKEMKIDNGRLITIASNSNTFYVNTSVGLRTAYNYTGIDDVSSLRDENTFWIAAQENGIVGFRVHNGQAEAFVSGIIQDSPKRNLMGHLMIHNDKLYIAGGERWINRLWNPATVMIYDNHEWFNLNEKDIQSKSGSYYFLDVTSIAVDPRDENHYFVSTWGDGVFEIKDNEFVQRYNHNNSTLENSNPSDSYYVRIEGLCFDKDNNLWMTNSSVRNAIKVLKADGTWSSLFFSELIGQHLIDKIMFTSWGDKWVNVVRGEPSAGIFIFNDNNTIDNPSDDTSRFLTSLYDSGGNSFSINNYFCIAEDVHNQSVWVGTDNGPIIIHNAPRAINNQHYSMRLVQNGEYFLSGTRVNTIAIDQGNRKWLGTNGSGVFVLNEDGSELIEQFNTDNSPLLSNTINSIVINDRTGEVFIGTEKGLNSYMGEATQGSEDYSNIYVYPNPVRPDFHQQVTITGLMSDSNVKITNVNGNLIYQAKSLGGQLTWDCKNRSGQRVATGVYLVLAANQYGNESVVTKIAVIK